jgi:hypothetical protein
LASLAAARADGLTVVTTAVPAFADEPAFAGAVFHGMYVYRKLDLIEVATDADIAVCIHD